MDTEDLANAALTAIDDWLDEEIIGFEPEQGIFAPFKICISVKPVRLGETYVKT